MKINWKGRWKNGEVTLEVDSPSELISAIKTLENESDIKTMQDTQQNFTNNNIGQVTTLGKPQLTPGSGCSESVREMLQSNWGRQEPRSMNEIIEVLEENALYFPKGTISGVLTGLVKRGHLRRLKKGSVWAYVYVKG